MRTCWHILTPLPDGTPDSAVAGIDNSAPVRAIENFIKVLDGPRALLRELQPEPEM